MAATAARADYVYTVHIDELFIAGYGTYGAEEFSFVAPELLGLPDYGYLSEVDLAAPLPIVAEFPIAKVSFVGFVESYGQLVFTARRPEGTTFTAGDVQSLFWGFLTPDGSPVYGPGTYGSSCFRGGVQSDRCFSRVISGVTPDTATTTGYLTVAPIPIPAAGGLFGGALVLLAAARRRSTYRFRIG